jgi:hypothetical protein
MYAINAFQTPFLQRFAELRQELHVPIGFSVGAVTVRLLVNETTAWELTVDVTGDSIRCGNISFPLPSLPWPRPGLRLFLDGSIIESFIGGREAITSRVYTLRPGETELEVTVAGKGKVELNLWPLNAISPDRLTS